jgi:ankyrin
MNRLFDQLGDSERHQIINRMDPKSRVRLASISKEAREWMEARVAMENRLIREALEGIEDGSEDASAYDVDYGHSALGVDRPLNDEGDTAMHVAARHGKVSLLRALVSLGGDPNVKNEFEVTPVDVAAEYSGPETLIALKELGAEIPIFDMTKWNASPVKFAARRGRLDNVQTLVQLAGGDSRKFVLFWVARFGNPEMVASIHRAYPGYLNVQDAKGRTPLHYAAMYNTAQVITLLVRLGASLEIHNSDGDTPLHSAVHLSFHHQGREQVRALLELGANIEAINEQGITPVLIAVKGVRRGAFHELCRFGANLFAMDHLGRNALHIAAAHFASFEVLTVLVELGFATDALDHLGLTPMHYAMTDDQTFRMLLFLGGHIDTPDASGRTPLHLTALLPTENIFNQEELVPIDQARAIASDLLEYGANPEIRDQFGRTPGDLALAYGRFDIAAIIYYQSYTHAGM